MDNAEFEKQLMECRDTLARLAEESRKVSERLCALIEEHDGDKGEWYWSCRTMNTDIEDVLQDTERRIRRFQSGDLRELPQVLILALECCERLQDTAELCRAGREDERRDLKGQISSNLGYLAHHLDSMEEDEYIEEDLPVFREIREMSGKAIADQADIGELKEFICSSLDPVHDFLKELREKAFWEDE
ncbi:MAG: hypothetical protein MJZ38_05025 [archaeon]|nr:hypothetical protein [archaeon]